MKKIPTLFERDWDGDRSRVVNKVNPEAAWVIDRSDVVCTEKIDGTSCLIEDGVLFARFTLREGRPVPDGFVSAAEFDRGKQPGWRPVDDRPDDQFHIEAFNGGLSDGSYELVGPKVQGNPYNLLEHELWSHTTHTSHGWVTPEWEAVKAVLEAELIEGLVWQLRDGNDLVDAVKVKRRDFGLPWPVRQEP